MSKKKQFRDDNDGQSQIDLLIAVSIFFTVIAVLLVQAPTLFFPQAISVADTPARNDAVGANLIDSQSYLDGLTEDGLTHEETKTFLERDGSNLNDDFNIDDQYEVRVRIIALNEQDTDYLTSSRDPPSALDPSKVDPSDYSVSNTDGKYYATVETTEFGKAGQTIREVHTTLEGREVVVEVSTSL